MPSIRRFTAWLVAGVVLGCGGGGGNPTGPTPSVVAKTGGDNQVGAAGSALATALEVTVKDASGNPLSGITVTFAAASGGGSVAPTSANTGADGKATTTRTLGPGAGTQTTTATVSGVTPASFSSIAQIQGAVTIAVSGSASREDTVEATVAPLTVLVKDQNGAPVQGVIVNWSGTAGALSQSKDTTDALGIASITWQFFGTAGTATVQAAVTGLVGSPVVFTGTIDAGNATQIAAAFGNFQAAPVNGVVILTVVVKDASSNGKPGVTVNWAAVGGGSVDQPTSITGVGGIAGIARLFGATSGAYGTTATVGSLAGSPVTFSDTAAAVTAISVGSGGNIFNPASATVTHGDFVSFNWAGGVTHNVVWDTYPTGGNPGDLPSMTSGSYLVRFTNIGAYTYHCSFHGAPGTGMHGSIDVN